MLQKQNYERPELLEVGAAEELTLGQADLPDPDSCNCSYDEDAAALLSC